MTKKISKNSRKFHTKISHHKLSNHGTNCANTINKFLNKNIEKKHTNKDQA